MSDFEEMLGRSNFVHSLLNWSSWYPFSIFSGKDLLIDLIIYGRQNRSIIVDKTAKDEGVRPVWPRWDRGHGMLSGRRGPEHGAPAGDRPQAGQLWGWAVTVGGVAAVMYQARE